MPDRRSDTATVKKKSTAGSGEEAAVVRWYAMRAYKSEGRAEKELEGENDLQYFIPKRYAERVYHGVRSRRLVPVIPSLVFVRASREQIVSFKKRYNLLQFMMWEKSTGLEYITVPDTEMESFIKVASRSEEALYHRPEEINLREGARVRVREGVFEGVTGILASVRGKSGRRMVVMLEGVLAVSVEISQDMLEVIAAE